MAFKLQDCIVANFFIKFKAAPSHHLREVPQMGQAEGKEGQMLFTPQVEGCISVPTWELRASSFTQLEKIYYLQNTYLNESDAVLYESLSLLK